MYTYLKFGLPRVFPPNMGSQRSHRRGFKGHINHGYRDSSGAGQGSSGYDSSDNETTRGRIPISNKMRKFRSESDFRTLGMMGHPRSNGINGMANGGNMPITALRQANSRASIAGLHAQHGGGGGGGKHYGYRSHSEADLLGGLYWNSSSVKNQEYH